MPPCILDLHYALPYAPPVVLILEAAPSSWQEVYDLASGLIERVMGRCHGLYFVGNRNAYPITLARDLREQAPAWYSANRERASCVGPIIETLEQQGFKGRIVIVASQCPVDLHDWQGTAVAPRLLLVNVGEMSRIAPTDQVDGRQGVDCILGRLEDPPSALHVTGPGFAPLAYDLKTGGRAEARESGGEFRLQIAPSGERLDLHLRALATAAPTLRIQHEKGGETCLAGEPEPPWWRASLWQPVPEMLRSVVDAGISRRPFRCPQCREWHPYDCLVCPQGDLVLNGLPLNTCLLLSRRGWQALFDTYAQSLSGGRILTRAGQLYAWRDERWTQLHPLRPYEQVDHGLWALFHTF